MKLEPKHVSAYLPYSLQIRDISENENFQLNGMAMRGDTIFVNGVNINSDYKLCLIPLSFLSSEFSFHASKIMTLHEDKHITTSKKVIQHQLLSLVNISLPIDYRISKTHKWIIDYLLENHFDIFGLIDAGLAVDINSL